MTTIEQMIIDEIISLKSGDWSQYYDGILWLKISEFRCARICLAESIKVWAWSDNILYQNKRKEFMSVRPRMF